MAPVFHLTPLHATEVRHMQHMEICLRPLSPLVDNKYIATSKLFFFFLKSLFFAVSVNVCIVLGQSGVSKPSTQLNKRLIDLPRPCASQLCGWTPSVFLRDPPIQTVWDQGSIDHGDIERHMQPP